MQILPKIVKKIQPDFIKKKDIREITPEYLIYRFGERATTRAYENNGNYTLTISVARNKNQQPDSYRFENGKFLGMSAERVCDNIKKYIHIIALKDRVLTKIYSSTNNVRKKYISIIETIEKPQKGFLGFFGLKKETLDLRIRLERIAKRTWMLDGELNKWNINLSNKTKRLTASNDSKLLSKEDYEGIYKLEYHSKKSKAVRKLLKRFDKQAKEIGQQ